MSGSSGDRVPSGALHNLKIGPQEEEFEFLVDMEAERTCVRRIQKRCGKSQNTGQVVGAKGEEFKALIHNVNSRD